jgi:D-alanyl-D-alanine carboxypeptidase
METMKQYLITLVVTLLIPPVFAQQFSKERLDKFFDSLETNKKAMGCMAISKNGQLLYNKAIGYSLYTGNDNHLANASTKYRIGSISKIYTAAMIFQLIEEGRLDISCTIDHFFPNIPNAAAISISNLLNHQSGIPHIINIKDRDKPHSHEEMLAFLASRQPEFTPGSKAAYSNSNYLLLGYVIENICGKSYADALKERIVEKIGLTGTYYGHDISPADNECYAYRLHGKWKQQSTTDLSIPGGSGAIVSTAADMVKFIEALFASKLTSAASLQEMRTMSGEFGMGLVQFEYGEKKAYGHPGGIDRFESVLAYFPGDSTAIAYCSNGHVTPVKDVVLAALDIYFDKPALAKTSAGKKQTLLQKYVGVYSNPRFPLRIVISRKKQNLVASAAGQPAYQLETVASGKFKCGELSVMLEFNTDKNSLILKKGSNTYSLSRER